MSDESKWQDILRQKAEKSRRREASTSTDDRHIRECTYQRGPCICSLLSRYGARVRSKTSNKTALAERARIRQAVIDSAHACDMAPEDMAWDYEALMYIIDNSETES